MSLARVEEASAYHFADYVSIHIAGERPMVSTSTVECSLTKS
jgi:hypothetical protein